MLELGFWALTLFFIKAISAFILAWIIWCLFIGIGSAIIVEIFKLFGKEL